MAKLSPVREQVPLLPLKLFSRGKVRDTYDLGAGRLLIIASDGISIFDFVLNTFVPQKGQVLTAMSHFWLKLLESHGINTHFLAAGQNIESYLPASLGNNLELLSRAMVVKKLDIHPVEFIARDCLTGSGLVAYRENGSVCGHQLPPGLEDGDQLPRILDTPTTKSVHGHDEHVDAAEIRRRHPKETYLLLATFQIISSEARRKGIVFADTKLEFGVDDRGAICIADEVGTPDSSRWWSLRDWQESRKPHQGRKAPPPFDKQLVRQWGIKQGINKLDPTKPEDLVRVHGLEVPVELIRTTTQTYRYIFWRLTGMTLENYFRENLWVKLEKPRKKVALIFGSESDFRYASSARGFSELFMGKGQVATIEAHVVSCHRNPEELARFVADGCGGADVVVAAGGKAFALPGVLDAMIYHSGQTIPVVGVALGESGTRAFEAALLSIEEVPGQPVVIDEVVGRVYCGTDGLWDALLRIDQGELPPPKPRVHKPAQFHLELPKLP